jgi:hypothetical protein
MGKTNLMQMAITLLDRGIDPGGGTIHRRLRTQRDNTGKIPIGGNMKPLLPNGLGQRMGQMKAIQRQDRPPLRLNPIDFLRRPIVGHGKDANGISLQQQHRVDRHYP